MRGGRRSFHRTAESRRRSRQRSTPRVKRDVLVAGGASNDSAIPSSGLIDDMRLAMVPVLLGGGETTVRGSRTQRCRLRMPSSTSVRHPSLTSAFSDPSESPSMPLPVKETDKLQRSGPLIPFRSLACAARTSGTLKRWISSLRHHDPLRRRLASGTTRSGSTESPIFGYTDLWSAEVDGTDGFHTAHVGRDLGTSSESRRRGHAGLHAGCGPAGHEHRRHGRSGRRSVHHGAGRIERTGRPTLERREVRESPTRAPATSCAS